MDKNKKGQDTMKRDPIDLRLSINPDDDIYTSFLDIKKATGIKNNSEVLRFALTLIASIPFSELIANIEKKLDSENHKKIKSKIGGV